MAYPIEYANDVLIEQLRDFRVLVTGGAGFIGSHLAKRLVAEGIDTTVLDNLSSGNLNNLTDIEGKNNFHFVKGDVRDSDIVKIATKDTNVIFHEAALVSIPQSIKDPLLANDINLVGTLNLLQAAVERGVKRFIFASSAAVYGESPEAQKKEETVTSPSNPYGVSKAAAESYLRIFNELYGIETVSLRYFNVYGPGQAFAKHTLEL